MNAGAGSSPLLKSVFLGLPQFTQFINIEIVWDLINVLREFFQFELEQNPKSQSKYSIANVLAGLLCVFQIIEVGAGTSVAVEEKDFIDALYTVIQRLYESPFDYNLSDFLSFLKCAHLVFVQKRQFSTGIIHAFAKRLAILQVHLPEADQAGVLLLIKQIFSKYPATRSCMLEADEDAFGGGFGDSSTLYRADINDPALSNAGETHAIFEFLHTYNQLLHRPSSINFKLVKSILQSSELPNECLGLTPL